MTMVRITVGPFQYTARLEAADAPETCAAFGKLLPYRQKIIHARWSGEACWIPLGAFKLGVGYENHTSHPAPGEIIFYPGGFSETEILFPYGACTFSSAGWRARSRQEPQRQRPCSASANVCRCSIRARKCSTARLSSTMCWAECSAS